MTEKKLHSDPGFPDPGFPELYERGKSAGIVAPGGHRYRLSRLGLADAFTEACDRWKVATGRLQELAGIAEERTAKIVREQGVRGAVAIMFDGRRQRNR